MDCIEEWKFVLEDLARCFMQNLLNISNSHTEGMDTNEEQG